MLGTSVSSIAPAAIVQWGHMGGLGWGMAIFGLLFMAGISALVIWLVVTSARGSGERAANRGSALDLLDARYARGEIDRDDYLQRRSDLER